LSQTMIVGAFNNLKLKDLISLHSGMGPLLELGSLKLLLLYWTKNGSCRR
jgi:hypothetical protein